jgi:hypothetical protein
MYSCPGCNETISADAAGCRFCHLAIDTDTAQRLLIESQQVTTAVAQANTFNLSIRVAVLLTGFALFNLYVDRSLTDLLVLCSFITVAYGSWWLWHNRSRVTLDADYPAAITKVKRTMMVWVAVLVVQLAGYVIVNGWRRVILQLSQPLAHKIIDDGNNRPVLSMAEVKAYHFPLFPGEQDPWRFPMLAVSFKNDGNTSAQLTQAAVKSYLPGGCDFTSMGAEQMGIVIPPGYEGHALLGVHVTPPCKTSGVIKLTVKYTNLASGLEYSQELSAPADLVFGDQIN